MITREDVLKFLKALDEHNVQNRDFDGSVVTGKSVELRKEYCRVLLEVFEALDIKVWETTTRLVIERKKPWPTPDEMVEYVSKVENAYRAKQVVATPAEPTPVQIVEEVKPTAKAYNRQERMKEMFALAAKGKFKEASSVFGAKGFSKKVMEYAKLLFPDSDEAWYEENILALQHLTNQQEICDRCHGVGDCRTRGYRQSGFIDKKTGMLSIVMAPCMLKKVESAENVSL